MKNYVLFNPLAGHGKSKDYLDNLKNELPGQIVMEDITKIRDYSVFLSKLEDEDVITICGGDGTLNNFINRTDTESIRHHIYYYGAGSGNDFLHDIAKDGDGKAIEINKYLEHLPTVTVKGKDYKFINGVGYGIDGYCCEVGDELKEKSDKPINYTTIAIKGLLFHYKPADATVIVDGEEFHYKKVWIAPTMNGRMYGGGMIPVPQQDRLNDEHTVSVMLFHGTGKLKTLMIFPSLFKGEHVKHTEAVSIHKGKEITVRFTHPAPLQIDGETVLDVSEYTVYAGVTAKV